MTVELQTCTRCLIPQTQETISFDSEGVCNICHGIETKHAVDWPWRYEVLQALADEIRGSGAYDCIVPFSGGKDSTFTLWYIVRQLHLNPLVVRFDHGFLRETVLANTQRTVEALGVDLMSFKPSREVTSKTMLESLKRKGDFCWHCHTGIFAYPMQVAQEKGIDTLFWGEPSAEYGAYYTYDNDEQADEQRFNLFINLGITAPDMAQMTGLEPRKLAPMTFPKMPSVRSLFLGSYIPWDVRSQVAIIKRELGWQGDTVEGIPPEYDYEKIECQMQGVRDYLRFLKRGYGRTAHLASIDIRNGRLTREEGAAMVERYDGKRPASLDGFLEYVGIDETEFNDIARSHVIAPWTG